MAPAALGYIFSVAKPMLDSPTMQNYSLPLLAIYARTIYLAYIYLARGSSKTFNRNLPIMCCIKEKYVVPKSNPTRANARLGWGLVFDGDSAAGGCASDAIPDVHSPQ